MKRFPGVDFMEFDSLLTEEERLVRDTVRAFVDDKVKPIIEECHRDARSPLELVPEMGALNLFGASLAEYGLPGLDDVAYGLIMQELERGDSGLRSFVSVQSSLVMYPIYAFGTEEQKDRWLPALAPARRSAASASPSPTSAPTPAACAPPRERDGDAWVLNGAKQWITNGTLADVAVVWAQHRRRHPRLPGREAARPGFTSAEQHGKFSLRASVTSELGFHDCRIPGRRTSCPRPTGLKAPLACLEPGALRHRLGRHRRGDGDLLRRRSSTPRSASSSAASRSPATSWCRRSWPGWSPRSPRASSWRSSSAGSRTRAGSSPSRSRMAKRNNVWVARECAKLAREILGANGIVDDYPVIRHMLNLESVYTYEGTHDIHGLVIGEAITGIPAFNRR